jgi:hypothetical protein
MWNWARLAPQLKSPLSDFRRAAEAAGLPTELHYLDRGESYRLGLDT